MTATIHYLNLLSIDECGQRIKAILAEHQEGISVEALCSELRRRGLAFDDLSPASLGFEGEVILRLAKED